jgi:hypothetical protein
MDLSVLSIVLVVLLWVAAIYLSAKTQMLKDISNGNPKPYSFARTQLLWWTLIIASCYILGYGHSESLPLVNNSCIALLGIGLGTTTLARVVDNTQVNQQIATGISRHQNETSQGFLVDLLSDETGISVHRFQSLIFNVIFGITYFTDFFNLNYVLPSYGNSQLLLLGISSGAYLAVKMNENGIKGGFAQTTTPLPTTATQPPAPAEQGTTPPTT